MNHALRFLSSVLCTVAIVLLAIGIAIAGQVVFADEIIVPAADCSGCTTTCATEDDGTTCKSTSKPQNCTGMENCTSCTCQTPPRGGCKCCKIGSSCAGN